MPQPGFRRGRDVRPTPDSSSTLARWQLCWYCIFSLAATVVRAHLPPSDTVAGCPVVPGYDVLPDSNVDPAMGCNVGGASVMSGRDWASAAQACDLSAACLGFAYSRVAQASILKTCTRPARRAPGVCLYTKLTRADCPKFPGFTEAADRAWVSGTEQRDVILTDLTDVKATANSCNTGPACASFNMEFATPTGVANGTTRRRADLATYARGTCAYTKVTTSCPSLPAYNIAVDQDHLADNIAALTAAAAGGPALGNLTAAGRTCSSEPRCIAFNSQGQFKSVANPLVYTRGSCLYTKTPKAPPGCPQVPGYAFTFDRDHTGETLFSIAGWSVPDIAKECDADSACKGFNNIGEGKVALPSFTVHRGTCFYTKMSTECAPYPGYDTLVDMVASEPPRDTLGDARVAFESCERNPSCTSFNSKGEVYHSSGSSITQRGVCQYIKTVKNGCADVPGYLAVADSDVGGASGSGNTGGDTSQQEALLAAARKSCDEQEQCTSFTSKGATFTAAATGTVEYARGTCLYLKIPTFCPLVQGYTAMPDRSVPRESLQDFTRLDEGIEFCSAKADCQGVSKDGLLIQAEPSTSAAQYQRGSCFYRKEPGGVASCPEVPGYRAFPGQEPTSAATLNTFAAGDIMNSLQGALRDCGSAPGCAGFSFGVEGSHYVAKTSSSWTSLAASATACFYNKTQTVCPGIGQGYEVDVDRTVPDAPYSDAPLAQNYLMCSINHANSLAASATTTATTTEGESGVGATIGGNQCHGITSDGRLDLTGTPRVYHHGVCYWRKSATFNLAANTQLVSLRKPAYSSSKLCVPEGSYACFSATKAVDGVTADPQDRFQSKPADKEGGPPPGNASSTVPAGLWLSVDLGDLYGIVRVVVQNRKDCCTEELLADGGVRLLYSNASVTTWDEAVAALNSGVVSSAAAVAASGSGSTSNTGRGRAAPVAELRQRRDSDGVSWDGNGESGGPAADGGGGAVMVMVDGPGGDGSSTSSFAASAAAAVGSGGGVWTLAAPGIARWVVLQKRNNPYRANASLAVQELDVYALPLPGAFRDDLLSTAATSSGLSAAGSAANTAAPAAAAAASTADGDGSTRSSSGAAAGTLLVSVTSAAAAAGGAEGVAAT